MSIKIKVVCNGCGNELEARFQERNGVQLLVVDVCEECCEKKEESEQKQDEEMPEDGWLCEYCKHRNYADCGFDNGSCNRNFINACCVKPSKWEPR